jgi:hypothetical protein
VHRQVSLFDGSRGAVVIDLHFMMGLGDLNGILCTSCETTQVRTAHRPRVLRQGRVPGGQCRSSGPLDRGVDQDEVELRFDILLRRAKLLTEGRFQGIIQDDPDQQSTLSRLADVLALVQPLIVELERPGSVQQTLQPLEPLEARLLQLASYCN